MIRNLSCVIPVKGARPYIKDALASIGKQGVDVEIIVQDGDIEQDSGQSDALNKGFAKAKGDWLFWLNADDVLLPNALKRVYDFIASYSKLQTLNPKLPPLEWIAGDTVYIDEKGIVKEVRTDAKWRPWFGSKLSVWTGGPSAFFKRSLWERLGGFDTGLKYVMDTDLWTRWAQSGVKFEGVNDYVWGFRMHDGSKTTCGRNIQEHKQERERMLVMRGLSHKTLWRNLSRVASVIDGSWFRRTHDSKVFYGKHWAEIG